MLTRRARQGLTSKTLLPAAGGRAAHCPPEWPWASSTPPKHQGSDSRFLAARRKVYLPRYHDFRAKRDAGEHCRSRCNKSRRSSSPRLLARSPRRPAAEILPMGHFIVIPARPPTIVDTASALSRCSRKDLLSLRAQPYRRLGRRRSRVRAHRAAPDGAPGVGIERREAPGEGAAPGRVVLWTAPEPSARLSAASCGS